MRLHELVSLKNQLETAIESAGILSLLEQNQSRLDSIVNCANEHYGNQISQISKTHTSALDVIKQDIKKVQLIINEIDKDIYDLTRKFFQENYQKECLFNDPNRIREIKKLVMTEGTEEILCNKIYLHSTWKYPGMEISCRDGEWTKYLVSSDPLYLVDMHQEFLDSANSKFTPEYQARLRKYLMKDFKVDNLPLNQFGFVFSHNFFNYLSLDSIKVLLSQIKDWLRPGGTMIFTYNNTDLSASAGLSEDYFMTYVPKSMLIPMIESLGFEIIDAPDYLPSTSWIELKKPGTLSTVKAHQALGEIKYY
jgi:SAM-dependent methyltransferase